MQVLNPEKPIRVNTDSNEKLLKPDESPFLKNYRISFNSNGGKPGIEKGGNFGVATPYLSNKEFPILFLPSEGINKNIGAREFLETNELYYMNANSAGHHGVYRINGDTLKWEIVYLGAELEFSMDPRYAIPETRINLTLIKTSDENQNKVIKSKILTFVNGLNWQYWIDTEASIATESFNAVKFPYWELKGPHFDKKEFIQWPVRPPMYAPIVTPVAAVASDKGKTNRMLKQSVQFAFKYLLTDGRDTILSPASNPYFLTDNPCNVNNSGLPRCVDLLLNAGSAHVEKIQVLVKVCSGDWYIYDTVEKFDVSREAKQDFWNRGNPWNGFSFDKASNTIKYRYCGDRETQIYPDQEEARMVEPDMPIKSWATTAVGNSLLLAHNLYGYDNLEQSELSKFSLEVVEKQTSETAQKNINIKLYAYIGYNGKESSFLYGEGPDAKSARFGGTPYDSFLGKVSIRAGESDMFGLNTGSNNGLLCYLAGTSFYSIGKQYKVTPDGIKTEIGLLDSNNQANIDMASAHIKAGGYFVQQFEFNVPRGTYIARLARHDANTESPYQKTSTYVIGIKDRKTVTLNVANNWDSVASHSKDIEVNACNGDYDSWNETLTMFSVFAPKEYETGGVIKNQRWRFIEGYVRESSDVPMGFEYMEYIASDGMENMARGFFTDHNGFFFQYTQKGEAYKSEVDFYGKLNCSSQRYLFSTQIKKYKHSDRGYYKDQNLTIKDNNGGTVGDCNRVIVKGKLTECTGSAGISGVSITITGGQTTYTGSDGSFELIVHGNGDRKGRIYINAGSGSGCLISPCQGDCSPIYEFSEILVQCSGCSTKRIYPTEINASFKFQGNVVTTMKDGERHGIAIKVMDHAKRGVFMQNIGYVDIPSFVEQQNYSPVQIKVNISAALAMPKEFKYISFYRTKGLNSKRRFQWVADKIEFLDVNGEVTKTGAGAIRAKITMQSLLEYNKGTSFTTTATYQFVDGDYIRFYDDGNGNLFDPKKTDGFMDYPILGTDFNKTVTDPGDATSVSTGNTVIIPFDQRLVPLVENCGMWIEIVTPQDNSDVEGYCSIPQTFALLNGDIEGGIRSIVLDTWDTYLINRKIKIPNCKGKAISHPFASPNVSDFWGKDCPTCGMIEVKDPQAEQKWVEKEAIKSNEIVNEGRVNGLGTFRAKNKHVFKGDWGGIIAVHDEQNILVFVCQNDWFITDYNMNYARVNAQGIVAVNLDQNIGDPHQKVGDNYGCEYEDISTIVPHSGIVAWLDRKRAALPIMNYQGAVDAASVDNKSYFENKITAVNNFNNSLSKSEYLSNMFEIIAGVDPQDNAYNITFRPRKGFSAMPQDYINNEREVNYLLPETFVFNIDAKMWSGWTAYCPESYGRLSKSITGKEMVVFAAGKPYFQNSSTTKDFNTFFGIATDQVIEIVSTADASKEQQFQGIAIESKGPGYYADRIITDKDNSFSYIPIKYFERVANIYYASIKCNMGIYPDRENPVVFNLVDGGLMNGLWIKIRLVRDPTKLTAYNELNNILVRSIGVGKSKK